MKLIPCHLHWHTSAMCQKPAKRTKDFRKFIKAENEVKSKLNKIYQIVRIKNLSLTKIHYTLFITTSFPIKYARYLRVYKWNNHTRKIQEDMYYFLKLHQQTADD